MKGGPSQQALIQPDREQVRRVIARHGWNVCSCQIDSPGILHWLAPCGDAAVGYVTRARTHVVAGAPICGPEHLGHVAQEWEQISASMGRRVCYFGAMQPLCTQLVTKGTHSAIACGALPIWNPDRWCHNLNGNRGLKAQLRRARNSGVTVCEWTPERAMHSNSLWECHRDWRSRHRMAPMAFVSGTAGISELRDKRIFVALQGEQVVAFLLMIPIPARKGWMSELFPRRHTAPNGSVELLVHHAITAAQSAGSNMFTLGFSPLSTSKLSNTPANPPWVQAAFRFAQTKYMPYNFAGLERFKQKFRPEEWEPVYCISSEANFSIRSAAVTLCAFTEKQYLSKVVRHAMAFKTRQIAGNLRLYTNLDNGSQT